MLYEKPWMQVIKLPIEGVVYTSGNFFDPENPENNSDMNNDVWD